MSHHHSAKADIFISNFGEKTMLILTSTVLFTIYNMIIVHFIIGYFNILSNYL